jgi:peptidoglycan/LPS O-acetylase OafA/YrhL
MLINSIQPFNGWYDFLNTKFMNYLGKLSYSLYIWQQLFFSGRIGVCGNFPLNLFLIFFVANLSYHFIEMPFLRLMDRGASMGCAQETGCTWCMRLFGEPEFW